MDDLYSKILWEGYGIKNNKTTRVRTGFVCKTDNGDVELKKARTRKKNLLFAHDVKEHLHNKGFININRFYTTKDNVPFFEKDETVYVVEKLLPKGILEEETLDDFKLGIKTLGEIHNLGKDIKTKFATWEEAKLQQTFQKRTNELGKVHGRIKKDAKYNNMDRLVMNAYDKCMNQCVQANDFLEKANYSQLFQKAKEGNVFCHGSFKGDAVRKSENNEIFISGFEYAKSDLHIIDLCNYLKRFLRKVGGTKQDVLTLILEYDKKNKLSYEESQLLKALAIYPEKFLGVINEHYNKRRCCVSSAMEERLTKIIKDENESISLLDYLEWSFSENLFKN